MPTAEYHRQEAARHLQEAADSFERCDTDGFLSQWASGKMSALENRRAEVAAAGGMAEFPGLYRRSDGARMRAKLIWLENQYRGGQDAFWSFQDENDRIDRGQKLLRHNANNSKRSNQWKAGYEVRMEQAPAEAFMDGYGFGLSGNCWAAVRRLDAGYPADAVPA